MPAFLFQLCYRSSLVRSPGFLYVNAETLCRMLAPACAAHLETRVRRPFAALFAEAARLVLKEFQRGPAIYAWHREYVFGAPKTRVLSRAFRYVHMMSPSRKIYARSTIFVFQDMRRSVIFLANKQLSTKILNNIMDVNIVARLNKLNLFIERLQFGRFSIIFLIFSSNRYAFMRVLPYRGGEIRRNTKQP